MTDDIIKKVFEVTVTQARVETDAKRKETLDRCVEAQAKERHFGELVANISAAIIEIERRSTQVSPESRASFYEQENRNLAKRLGKLVQALHDEAQKLSGSVIAYDEVLTRLDNLKNLHDSELSKARDINSRAESGDLNKPRKPGTRPDKLKDVRNYVPAEDDK